MPPNLGPVSATESFFERGGNSLRLVKLAAEINQRLGRECRRLAPSQRRPEATRPHQDGNVLISEEPGAGIEWNEELIARIVR